MRVVCDIPQKLEHKEPELSSPGSVCGTLTWSSLYTELITVMQRAQFSSNKAREINGDRGGKRKTERDVSS